MKTEMSLNDRTDQWGNHIWEGYCKGLFYKTNIQELQSELMVFEGETKRDVVNQVVAELQARGLHGTLKVR